ncbi:hypothetical protein ACFX5D_14690 [Flavobacterium sp. LB3P45]|uniref:Uncharacterized protein n=1 Tax=Flavobacterium fructosi TaxID=3230416 RepID=A0ABW6HQ75_9FLAO
MNEKKKKKKKPNGTLNEYYKVLGRNHNLSAPYANITLTNESQRMNNKSFYINPMIKLFIGCVVVITLFRYEYIGDKISQARTFIAKKTNTIGTTEVEVVYSIQKPEHENRKRINAAGDYKTLDEIVDQSISQYPYYTAKGSMFNHEEDEYVTGTFYIVVDVAQEKHYIDQDEENGKYKHLNIIIWTYFVKQGERYKTFFSQTQEPLFTDNEGAEHYTQMMVDKYVSNAKSYIVYKTNKSKKDFDFKTIDETSID